MLSNQNTYGERYQLPSIGTIRSMRRLRANGWAYSIILFLLSSTEPLWAGRMLPKPVLIQLESGYGVVTAEVVVANKISQGDDYPGVYDVHFKVHSILAQPTEGPVFSLRMGDQITIRLTAGYACQLEDSEATPGKKFILFIKKQDGGCYEHADGASAAQPVEAFRKEDGQYYAAVRALAAVPKAKRFDAWINCLKDPKAPSTLREAVCGGFFEHLWPGGKVDPAETQRLVSAFRAIWKDPSSGLSIQLTEDLDYLLGGTDVNFDKSEARATVWLARLFALTPELRQDDNGRDNLAYQYLGRLIIEQPALVGRTLVVEMFNRNWPPLYRRAISAALLSGYCQVSNPDPSWEPSLQRYYATGLLHETDAFALRMMAVDIKGGLSIPQSRRKFVANAEVRASLQTAIGRLAEMGAQNPQDIEPGVAIADCKDALQALRTL